MDKKITKKQLLDCVFKDKIFNELLEKVPLEEQKKVKEIISKNIVQDMIEIAGNLGI